MWPYGVPSLLHAGNKPIDSVKLIGSSEHFAETNKVQEMFLDGNPLE